MSMIHSSALQQIFMRNAVHLSYDQCIFFFFLGGFFDSLVILNVTRATRNLVLRVMPDMDWLFRS